LPPGVVVIGIQAEPGAVGGIAGKFWYPVGMAE
jgi:hypothetical protein